VDQLYCVSIPLAQQGHQVTGLDLAEGMLDEARRKSTQVGCSGEVGDRGCPRFCVGRALQVDLLASQFHLPFVDARLDLEACLACVKRHLRPQGRFAVTVFVPNLALLLKTPEEVGIILGLL
jgi:ubiquinone/menaquinone biosynthesis C-methylase UbiE